MLWYEVRFAFSARIPHHGDVEIAVLKVRDCSHDALRNAVGLVVGRRADLLRYMDTHSIVACVGLHKDCGGLGLAHPVDSVVLYSPSACVCQCVSKT